MSLTKIANEYTLDPQLEEHMLQTMQDYQAAQQQMDEANKLPHFHGGVHAAGFLGGGLLGGMTGGLAGRKIGYGLPLAFMSTIPGAFAGIAGTTALEHKLYPEYTKAYGDASTNHSSAEESMYNAAFVSPTFWDRTRTVHNLKTIPSAGDMEIATASNTAQAPSVAPNPQQPHVGSQAQALAAALMLANQIASMRQTYTPEIKQQVEQKQTEMKAPTVTKRQGTFTTAKSLGTEKTASERDLTMADRIGLGLYGTVGLGGGAYLAGNAVRELPPVFQNYQTMTDQGLQNVRIPTSELNNRARNLAAVQMPDDLAEEMMRENGHGYLNPKTWSAYFAHNAKPMKMLAAGAGVGLLGGGMLAGALSSSHHDKEASDDIFADDIFAVDTLLKSADAMDRLEKVTFQ